MKFERTDEYMQKLFEQAMFDEKHVIKDAHITIMTEKPYSNGKLKAWCENSHTFLQFPRNLRKYAGQEYIADVVEVIRDDGVRKYFRAMKGSIRNTNSDEVVA